MGVVGKTTVHISSELGTEKMCASVIWQAGELGITASSPQIVNCFFSAVSTGESKSVTHFQETQNMLLLMLLSDLIVIHSRTMVESIFSPGKVQMLPPLPIQHDSFTMQYLSFCDTLLHNVPAPLETKGQFSSADNVGADWANSLGSKIFVPVLCVYFPCACNKVLWKVTDGQLLFMSTRQYVPFVKGSVWPSLDTCSAPETNV